MDALTVRDLRRLRSIRDPLCLSLYLPTVRAGREVRQNSIRFGNLLGRATELLREAGVRARQTQGYLKPLVQLEHDEVFWQQQEEGLALVRTPRRLLYYRLPERFEELAVLSERPHIKPLLELFTGNGRFFALALSRAGVTLYQGTRYGLAERRIQRVPASLAEAMRYDQVEKQIQFHTGTAAQAGPGRRVAMYHGQGAGKAEVKDQLRRYFRGVNSGVRRALRGEHAPLVLIGLETLFPIYREANTYPQLLEEAVDANADALEVGELHERAWEVVQPVFARRLKEAADEYARLAGGGPGGPGGGPGGPPSSSGAPGGRPAAAAPPAPRTVGELEPGLRAAAQERVATLFLPRGRQRWGRFDPGRGRVTTAEGPAPGQEDLLDLAAVRTLGAGGTVYLMDPEQIPGGGELAAVLRF